jgi:hypothetical protein
VSFATALFIVLAIFNLDWVVKANIVVPAKAGTQRLCFGVERHWVPAFAGTTMR